MSTFREEGPISRPVYMETADLPYPHIMCAAILRTDTHTSLRVHPGSPTTQVAIDIATQIYMEEAPGWLRPFGHTAEIDLAAIRSDPAYALGDLVDIPTYAHLIPTPLRVPWAPHLYIR